MSQSAIIRAVCTVRARPTKLPTPSTRTCTLVASGPQVGPTLTIRWPKCRCTVTAAPKDP